MFVVHCFMNEQMVETKQMNRRGRMITEVITINSDYKKTLF